MKMRWIYLIAPVFSVFIRPMPLQGQEGTDGPVGRAKSQEASAAGARCGTGYETDPIPGLLQSTEEQTT
jgi:hypothetical protein